MSFKGGLAAALAVLALTAAPADAASTRAEYIAQVEPICISQQRHEKAQIRRLQRSLDKAIKKIERNGQDLKKPGRVFGQIIAFVYVKLVGPTNALFEQATAEIAAVPPAPGDEAVIAAWLAGRNESSLLTHRALRAAKHRKLKRMEVLDVQAIDALRRAQAPVNAFGFQACFIELPVL